MLFDVDHTLVRKLARDAGVGKRDLIIRSVRLGPDEVTFVGAKSESGLAFVQAMKKKLPKIDVDPYEYDDEDRDEDDDDDDSSDDDE